MEVSPPNAHLERIELRLWLVFAAGDHWLLRDRLDVKKGGVRVLDAR